MASAMLLLPYKIDEKTAQELLKKIRPIINDAWKEITKHQRGTGEVFCDVPVIFAWNYRISDLGKMLVELSFSGRGNQFEKELVGILGRALHGKWSMQISLRFKRGASSS